MIKSTTIGVLIVSTTITIQLQGQNIHGFVLQHNVLRLQNPVHLFVSKQSQRINPLFVGTSNIDEEILLDEEDEETPNGVVCARGICVIADEELADEICFINDEEDISLSCIPNPDAVPERNVLSLQFLWPRALLLGCSLLYGTNFPLGSIMNEALPASATTSGRMLLASLALSPFLFQIKPELVKNAMIGGSFCALGYLSQSVALLDVPAATVAFLGALVVIITPFVNVVLGKDVKMGWKDAPQTWLAAILCLVGVGALELGGEGGLGALGWGDVWAVLQAVGFGTAFFFTEGMMARNPGQALPITAVQVSMTALFAAVWAALDGTGVLGGFGGDNGAWLLDETTRSQYAIPGLFLSGLGGDETLRTVALAAGWTGLITTAGNRVCETTALGKVSSSEASVLLATEPLWAALFAALWLGDSFGAEDYIGGGLIVVACLLSAAKAETLREIFGIALDSEKEDTELVNGAAVVMAVDGAGGPIDEIDSPLEQQQRQETLLSENNDEFQ